MYRYITAACYGEKESYSGINLRGILFISRKVFHLNYIDVYSSDFLYFLCNLNTCSYFGVRHMETDLLPYVTACYFFFWIFFPGLIKMNHTTKTYSAK